MSDETHELAEAYRTGGIPAVDDVPTIGPTPRVGQLDATVQLLTTEQARAELPHLFAQDEADPYFNMQDATGNAQWVDYWPHMVVVVRNPTGAVVMVSNASQWHMRDVGYPVPHHQETR